MRLRKVLPLGLALCVLVLLGTATLASSSAPPKLPKSTNDQKHEFERAHKTKIGDEVMVLRVWRNCKFHIVRLPAVRETATLPNGEKAERLRVAGPPDEM